MSRMCAARGLRASVVAVLVATAGSALAAYPEKVVRVINPAAPGGNSDILFRMLAPKMGQVLGQQLVVDYRVGAGGTIGCEITARSAPDGYTTALVAASFLINPAVREKLPYDTLKDFTALGQIVDIPAGFVVHPSVPVKNVKEFVAFAKQRPGQVFYASSGPGGVGHLAGELLSSLAGLKMVHVPYKGAGPAVVDLIGGQTHISFVSVPLVMGHVKNKRLRLLAHGGDKRTEALPGVPTMQEAGVPGFVVSSGFSFIGPAGIPRPIVDKLNGALVAALKDPANRKALLDRGAVPVGSSPDEHARFIKAEVGKWTRVANEANIRIR